MNNHQQQQQLYYAIVDVLSITGYSCRRAFNVTAPDQQHAMPNM